MPNIPDTPFCAADLPSLGLTHRALQTLIEAGTVRRVVYGAYVRAAVPDTVELRAAAAALVLTPHHVAVDRTAAWLHGVDVLTLLEKRVLPPIESCALRGRTRSRRDGVDGRTRDLAPSDITSIAGVRVTTPLRTACDLGCNLREREALAALNEFARLGVTQEAMTQQLGRYRRRRGVRQLRELIPLIDPRIESPRESWTLAAIVRAGLPRPEPQFWVEIDGIPTYRLDFAYPWARTCVEYDGAEAHDGTPEQRERDERRRAWLRAQGWTVIVVRSGDFTGDRLDTWLRELRSALSPSYTNRRW